MYDIDQEKREAIEAGERAICSLRAAENDLSSARGWGIWDMLGGGFISTMLKHSNMDNAKLHMEQAKSDIQKFSKELSDLTVVCNLNIETSDFLTFADWFFDGFFVDWMVQDRINTARNQVIGARKQVEDIVNQLKSS